MSENHLVELAASTVKQALERGAADAECTIAEGSEFSVNVRLREVESLKQAGSRGAGLRILIGNGPEAMRHVSMVGNDLQLDEGIGICGKEGQSVPVGVGIPTIKVDRMTVGGTA